MKEQTFITFQFYSSKNERLTIYYSDGIVTVLPCNKNDQFIKQVGKEICEDINSTLFTSKEKFNITFYKQKDFLDWCRNTYFKLQIIDRQKPINKWEKVKFKYVIEKNGKIKEYHLYKEKTI